MKTIYSLREFYQEVKKIAADVPEDYCKIGVEIDHRGIMQFNCYVHNKGMHTGATMEEALQKLKDAIAPPPPKNIDLEIDISQIDLTITTNHENKETTT